MVMAKPSKIVMTTLKQKISLRDYWNYDAIPLAPLIPYFIRQQTAKMHYTAAKRAFID